MNDEKRESKVYINLREFLGAAPRTDFVSGYIERETSVREGQKDFEYWQACLTIGDGDCKHFHFDAGGLNSHQDEQEKLLLEDLAALDKLIEGITEFRNALGLAITERNPENI